MSTLENLVNPEEIRLLVRRGWTHIQIAHHYSRYFPNQRGLSERSVRRLCHQHNIVRLSNQELDNIVRDVIIGYGHGYGRSMMQGAVRHQLVEFRSTASQHRISASLRRIAPVAYQSRARDILEGTNPIPYFAPYFGYKVHMDQNEKIAQDFGCTHVALIDGCSRMICGYSSMPASEKSDSYLRTRFSTSNTSIWLVGPIESGSW